MRRKLAVAVSAVVILGALAVAGLTSGAIKAGTRPKPDTFYVANWTQLHTDETGTHVDTFLGDCTPSQDSKYSFLVTPGPFVSKSGKFHWAKLNAVDSSSPGDPQKKSKVTIDGRFVSKNEATGTSKLHKPGCTTIKFDAKIQK